MAINILKKSHEKKTTFRLFRHFYLVSVVAIIIILIVAGFGLKHILKNFAIHTAEHTAIHISSALSDNQIKQFMSSRHNERQTLSISQEELPKLDHDMRKFLTPFEIVKIKIFDTESRIIYSTDPTIIGKVYPDNAKLVRALSGETVSKYETKEHVWDIADEQRIDVEIVETYVPIYNSDGKIIGSFEIYKDVAEHMSMMQKHFIFAWVILSITVLVVFATLMFIIHLGAKVIKSNTAKLISSNKKLKVEIINRETAESNLKEHKEMLEAMFRTAPFGLLLLNKDLVIQKANDVSAKLGGKEISEMIDCQPGCGLCCIHSYDNPKGCGYGAACSQCALRKTIASVLSSGQAVYKTELQPTLLVDGTEVSPWLEVSVERLEIDSDKYVLLTLSNITARKQAEEEKKNLESQLLQSHKLEAVGTLASGIAHDFNNVLSAIIGYTDLALEDAPKETVLHSNLQEVLIAGNRAKELVKQILAFSRKSKQQQEPVEVASIIAEALKMLRSSLPATIEICQDIRGENSIVTGDSTQIHQVLINLCTNASHAMREEKGTLTVKLETVEVEAGLAETVAELHQGDYIKLTVSDTGCGMDDATVERIFEPFFTTKSVDEGTGMGLSVVHGIVQSHDGAITVESEPGVGTTFTVYLPCAEQLLPTV